MNPEPFPHWVWGKAPAHAIGRLVDFVQERVGCEIEGYVEQFNSIEHGDHRPLNTESNYDPVLGWRRLHLVIFQTAVWESGWGGHMELWGQHDVAPAVSYVPAPGRSILLEYGDRHWWGFPVPVRGPRPLNLYEVVFYSSVPPEGASAPHAGFPHPKGVLAQ